MDNAHLPEGEEITNGQCKLPLWGSNREEEDSIHRFNSITYGKYSLRYLGPVLWAKIPSNIRQSLTLKVFKKTVRGLDLGALVDGEGCEGLLGVQ